MASQQMIFSQVTKTDSTKTKAEKVIEGVQLRGNTNKNPKAILGEQRKAYSTETVYWCRRNF